MTKALSENFESIRLHECLTFTQLKNVVRRVTWVHTADIKLLDLVKTVTVYLRNMSITMTGETPGEVCIFWTLQNSVKLTTNSWILTSRQHFRKSSWAQRLWIQNYWEPPRGSLENLQNTPHIKCFRLHWYHWFRFQKGLPKLRVIFINISNCTL